MTTGTVFDIGYQNYTGEREDLNRSQKAVFKDGLRAALGLGRPPRSKALPWFFIGVLALIGLIMALVAGAAMRFAGAEARERLPSHADYYGIASMILFLFAALVGPELLCRDRREGTINLYLVRPLTGADYVVSRWFAFFVVLLTAAWLPQIILFIGLSMGDPTPLQYLRYHWLDVPQFLAAGAAMAAYLSSLSLLVASFTTRRAYASIFLVGLFVVSAPFTIGLAMEIGGKAGAWISMFNLSNIPVHMNDIIFADVSEITEDAPARNLAEWVRIAWYFGWTLLPAAILWFRYRRMTP